MNQNVPASIRIELDRLCDLLGREFAVEPSLILTSDKHRSVTRARAALWLCMRERYKLSYPEMERMLGYDHTSILVGVRKARALEEDNELWRLQYRTARNEWLALPAVSTHPALCGCASCAGPGVPSVSRLRVA